MNSCSHGMLMPQSQKDMCMYRNILTGTNPTPLYSPCKEILAGSQYQRKEDVAVETSTICTIMTKTRKPEGNGLALRSVCVRANVLLIHPLLCIINYLPMCPEARIDSSLKAPRSPVICSRAVSNSRAYSCSRRRVLSRRARHGWIAAVNSR